MREDYHVNFDIQMELASVDEVQKLFDLLNEDVNAPVMYPIARISDGGKTDPTCIFVDKVNGEFRIVAEDAECLFHDEVVHDPNEALHVACELLEFIATKEREFSRSTRDTSIRSAGWVENNVDLYPEDKFVVVVEMADAGSNDFFIDSIVKTEQEVSSFEGMEMGTAVVDELVQVMATGKDSILKEAADGIQKVLEALKDIPEAENKEYPVRITIAEVVDRNVISVATIKKSLDELERSVHAIERDASKNTIEREF